MMKRFYLLLATLLSLTVLSYGQFEDQQSTYKYYYKLNSDDVKDLIFDDEVEIEQEYLHSKVDSISTDSIWQVPSYGTFLELFFEENKLKANLIANVPFEVSIIDNQTDLAIKITDDQNNIITDAEVKIRKRKLRFKKDCGCYRIRKYNKGGILSVAAKSELVQLPINRKSSISKFRKLKNGFLYRSPVKYVVAPIGYVINLPIDGYKSIKRNYAQGTIRNTANFFEKLYRKTACIFDDWYCDDAYDYNDERKEEGYIVFSQPKYRLGDTLRMKSFITKRRRSAWNKPVVLDLYRGYNKILFTDTIAPYSPGAFTYDLPLLSELGLELDQKYTVELSSLNGKELIEDRIQIEDYELTGAEMKVTGVQKKQYPGQKITVLVKGIDENKLPLYDARFKVTGMLSKVESCPTQMTSLPDTLFEIAELSNTGSAEIVIPDSCFRGCALDYRINIAMLTSDNDRLEESHVISYRAGERKIIHTLKDSTIIFHYEVNGKRVVDEPMHLSFYRKGLLIHSQDVRMPYLWERSIFADSIDFLAAKGFSHNYNINDIESRVDVGGQRTVDSVMVDIANPLGLSITYFLYRNNQEVAAGTSKSIRLRIADASTATYALMISYDWAGRSVHNAYTLGINRSALTVTMDQPETIYPGMKDTLIVQVEDAYGKPVVGIDVAAFGLTDKFDYDLPNIPQGNDVQLKKKYYNQFTIADDHKRFEQTIAYWQRSAFPELKTKHYYQLIQPGGKVYRHAIMAKDGATQFAPFVVDQGKLKYCNVIYVDGRPVYFGWNNLSAAYSFKITPGLHTITLRTDDAEIEIKGVYFTGSMKTILSIDQGIPSKHYTVTPKSSRLTDSEKYLLYNYIFPYELTQKSTLTTVYSGSTYHVLQDRYTTSYGTKFTGPVAPNNFTIEDHMRDYRIYDHHEAMYVYHYRSDYLKMKSIDRSRYPQYANSEIPWDFNAAAITEKGIGELYQALSKEKLSIKYSYKSSRTLRGNGRIQLVTKSGDVIQNILLLNDHAYNDVRLCRGYDRMFHNLKPGQYSLIAIANNSAVVEMRRIEVSANNLTVVRYDTYTPDSDSIKMNSFKEILNRFSTSTNSEVDMNQEIINKVRKSIDPANYSMTGKWVEGVIRDDTGEPLIGATVMVPNTDIGASTDIDGTYRIFIPDDVYGPLEVSYVGFHSVHIDIGDSNVVDVTLSEGYNLEEVVVVGYSAGAKRSLTQSAATISSSNLSRTLQGKAMGVSISGNAGSGNEILIRGYSTIAADAKPLIIVNGVPVTSALQDLNPDYFKNIEILKSAEAIAIYGSRAADGVIIITTTEAIDLEPLKLEIEVEDNSNYTQSGEYSIRSNFKDNAFWEPTLTTDKNGQASFIVQFPDDITKWKTYAIAMDRKLRSGTTIGNIRSYKPLLAELKLPRFMTEGDLVNGIGAISNYASDSLKLQTVFQVDEEEWKGEVTLRSSFIDTLSIQVTGQDSMNIEYSVLRGDGYMDGERRKIMVQPLGIEKPVGTFNYLNATVDTTLSLSIVDSLGTAEIWIDNTNNSTLIAHLEYLEHYKYGCNEQLSSRLIGELVRDQINVARGKRRSNKSQINKIINQLVENQNDAGLWSWYGKSNGVASWTSNHVMRALSMAKELGYSVNYNTTNLRRGVQLEFAKDSSIQNRLHLIEAAYLNGATGAAKDLFESLKNTRYALFNDAMHYAQVAALLGNSATDILKSFIQESGLGNTYLAPNKKYRWWGYRDVSYINGYAAMQRDTLIPRHQVEGVKNHFYRMYQNRGFNTYTSALWLYYNWKDLLDTRKADKSIKVIIENDTIRIDSFPFFMQVDQSFEVMKPVGMDLYVSTNQTYFDRAPTRTDGIFDIRTKFIQDDTGVAGLEVGKPTVLRVDFVVKGAAEELLLKIPIPASCSYSEKPQNFRYATHAAYFREEVAIFYDDLPEGSYEINIPLLPKYSGSYNVNAAQAYMMYNPEKQGNNELKRLEIR